MSTNFVCPDKNCTHNNGTGIYYAENGFAGLGDAQFMITHFLNTSEGVRFQGRYLDPISQRWHALAEPGIVERAVYPGLRDPIVKAVSEEQTMPRWTLQGPPKPTTPGKPIAAPSTGKPTAPMPRLPPGVKLSPPTSPLTQVTGADLRNLELTVSFWVAPDQRRRYILDFAGSEQNLVPASPSQEKRQPVKLAMRWRLSGTQATSATPYCRGAAGNPDTVVFQRGITVDPSIGAVARNPAAVTMSCSLGAPAKVYAWGYDYDPARADVFDFFRAGIHMKRASYCGDSEFYTATGTELLLGDSLGISRDLPAAGTTAAQLEAWWTPDGASCVNRAALRQPTIAAQKGFQGVCKQRELPACELPRRAGDPRAPYLIDAPKQPKPR